MTRRRRPAAVRRFVWAPFVWLVLATAVFGGLFISDLRASRPHPLDPAEESAVLGTAVDEDGEVKVRYRHPVTEQEVVAPLWAWDERYLADPGEEVRLIAQHDDPLSVRVQGDRFPLTTNLVVYGLWIVAASLPFVMRLLGVCRAEWLAASPEPTFAMLGSLVGGGLPGRCHLQLFPLDAPADAEPLCSVRVLTTGHGPVAQRTFPVEVKGSPRPFGRVVAKSGGAVLWPAGRALGRRSKRRRPVAVGGPPRPLEPAPAPSVPWRGNRLHFFRVALIATGAAILFPILVLVTTLGSANRIERIERDGRPAVGEVVGHDGADDVVVLEYEYEGRRHKARAGADFASDYPIGIRYPIRVARDDPGAVRLTTEPYDVIEPLIWAALPLVGALLWLGHRGQTWRRIRRAATNGPWWRAAAMPVGFGSPPTIGIRAGDDVIAGLRIPSLPVPVRSPPPVPVVVAGGLEPGEPAALWWEGTQPETPLGTVVIPALPVAFR